MQIQSAWEWGSGGADGAASEISETAYSISDAELRTKEQRTSLHF